MTQSGNQSIQSTLKETRTFAPPATFSASAHISSEQQYEAMWNRAKDDPCGLLGRNGGQSGLVPPLGHRDAGAHARYKMVRRRQDQRQLQLHRPTSQGTESQQSRHHLGR